MKSELMNWVLMLAATAITAVSVRRQFPGPTIWNIDTNLVLYTGISVALAIYAATGTGFTRQRARKRAMALLCLGLTAMPVLLFGVPSHTASLVVLVVCTAIPGMTFLLLTCIGRQSAER